MSEFASDIRLALHRNVLPNDRVWLKSGFRVLLIKKGIEKAGSINKLGRELGYRSKVHPGWSVRQILLGKQAFPYDRLHSLAKYLGYSMEDVLRYKAKPERVTTESTRKALRDYGLWYYIPR